MAGQHTLNETELAVASKLGDLELDYTSMAVVSNLFRAVNAVRNHLERSVLAKENLTWTAFVVLWVTWIWEPIETREIAAEAGVSKATVSGVLTTLENRGLLERTRSTADARLVLVTLTPSGRRLMKRLFPQFNAEERNVCQMLPADERPEAANYLRLLIQAVESGPTASPKRR